MGDSEMPHMLQRTTAAAPPPMPTTAAELIASIHARLAALDAARSEYECHNPEALLYRAVVVSADGLFLAFDIDGDGIVSNPRVCSLIDATKFQNARQANSVANVTRNGNGKVATSMRLGKAFDHARAELEKSLAVFKD